MVSFPIKVLPRNREFVPNILKTRVIATMSTTSYSQYVNFISGKLYELGRISLYVACGVTPISVLFGIVLTSVVILVMPFTDLARCPKTFYILLAIFQLISLVFSDILENLPRVFWAINENIFLRRFDLFSVKNIRQCQVSNMIRYVADSSGSYLIVLFSFVRFCVVRFPLKSQQFLRLFFVALATILVVSVTCNALVISTYTRDEYDGTFECMSTNYHLILYSVTYIMNYTVPNFAILLPSLLCYVSLRRSNQQAARLMNSDVSRRGQRKQEARSKLTTLTAILIGVTRVVIHGPYSVLSNIAFYLPYSLTNGILDKYMIELWLYVRVKYLSFMVFYFAGWSPIIDFVVYLCFVRQFRAQLKLICLKICCCKLSKSSSPQHLA